METHSDEASGEVSRRQVLKLMGYGGLILGTGPALLAACTSSKSNAGSQTGANNSPQPGGSTGSGPAKLVAVQRGVREVAFDPMDAQATGNGVTINLNWYIYEGLYVAGAANPTTFHPQLAAGDPVKVDDTTYKVKLRSGAMFHDGSPVTADDVVFSFNRVIGMGATSFLQKYLVNFDKVTATGTDEITFKLKKPMYLFEQRAQTVKIMSKAAVGNSKPGDKNNPALNYKPIGSGPYKVVSADPTASCKMTRFDKYNGLYVPSLTANEIDFQIITDANARVAALQSGSVDAITAPPQNAVDSLKNTPNLAVQARAGSLASHIAFFNASKPPFNDYRVVQAFMYGLDRNAIVTAAYNGFASVADSLVPPGNADYAKPSTVYSHDPEKAKSLLKAAGYPNGLSFEFQVGTEDPTMVASGQLIQQQLKDAGMNVHIRQGDTGGLYTRVTNGQFQAMYAGTSPALLGSADAEFIYRWLYYGSFIEQYAYWKGAKKDQVESLLDQAVSASGASQYNSLMAQVQNICAQFGPVQPIVHPILPMAYSTSRVPSGGVLWAPVGDLIFARNV